MEFGNLIRGGKRNHYIILVKEYDLVQHPTAAQDLHHHLDGVGDCVDVATISIYSFFQFIHFFNLFIFSIYFLSSGYLSPYLRTQHFSLVRGV